VLPHFDCCSQIPLFRRHRGRQRKSRLAVSLTAVFSAVVLMISRTSAQERAVPVPVQPGKSGSPIWKLSPGDMFRARIVLTRTTTITMNGQALPPEKSQDLLLLEYRLRGLLSDGEAVFQVRVLSAELGAVTETGTSTAARNKEIADSAERKLMQLRPVPLQVSPEGSVRVVPESHTQLLEQLAASDAAAFNLLRKASPEEICSSWFGRPFWFPTRDLLIDAKAPWTATCTDSCGPFGVLQTEITLERLEPSDGVARCQLKGTPRFVPLVLPATEVSSTALPITELKVDAAEFTGTAELRRRQPSGAPAQNAAPSQQPSAPNTDPAMAPPQATPPFQSLDTLLKVSGRGTLSENLKSQLKAGEFQFEFTQQSRFMIIGFSFRENDRLQALPR